MRVVGGVVGLCALAAAAGCVFRPATPPGPPASQVVAKALRPVLPAGTVVLQSVLLERPLGDRFLDGDLWESTVPAGRPETRALLAENGVRAGVLSGTLPQELQDLLDSEAETVAPGERTFNSRKESVVPTAGPTDPCQFSLLSDLAGEPHPVELKLARSGVLVRPRAVEGNRVAVHCEPQIQHGARRDQFRPTEDGTGFTKSEEVPLERFPRLAFEATVGPDDCLVIGWDARRPNTLGQALFAVEADNRPRQRVLVIRARQSGVTPGGDLPAIAGPYRR
jgi:hypothetical protein